MRAIKKEDLFNMNYYQVPKWLMDLFIAGGISQGAFKTYVLMYDRIRISAKKGWIDKEGDVYIKYSYDEMQTALDCSRQSISNNIKDLEKLELVTIKKCFNSSSIYYLNIYNSSQENSTSKEKCTSKENLTISSLESCTADSLENLTISSLENLDSSNNNSINNNSINNNKEIIKKEIDNNNTVNSDKDNSDIKTINNTSDNNTSKNKENESIIFKNNFKKYVEVVEKSTGKNKEEISRVINPHLFKDIDIKEVLNKISESKYLKGEKDTKPVINIFCATSSINRILIGFYDDRPEKKECKAKPEVSQKKKLTAEDYNQWSW